MLFAIWLLLVLFFLSIRLYFAYQNARSWGHDTGSTDILEDN